MARKPSTDNTTTNTSTAPDASASNKQSDSVLDITFGCGVGEATSLRDLMRKAKKDKVVVASFPKAGTPGCSKQIKAFNDVHADLEAIGYLVVGASLDTPTAQKSFSAKLSLEYPLASNASELLTKMECISAQKKVIRSVVAIDQQGKIIYEARKVKPVECCNEFKTFAQELASKEAEQSKPKGKESRTKESKPKDSKPKESKDKKSNSKLGGKNLEPTKEETMEEKSEEKPKKSEIRESKVETKSKKPKAAASQPTTAPKAAAKNAKAVKKIEVKKPKKKSQ